MTLTTRTQLQNYTLNDLEARRVRRHLNSLGHRLAAWPDPVVSLLVVGRPTTNQVEARLRARLGHLGGHVVARAKGDTADHAVRQAAEQLDRQLEKELAERRGEIARRRAAAPEPAEPAVAAEPSDDASG